MHGLHHPGLPHPSKPHVHTPSLHQQGVQKINYIRGGRGQADSGVDGWGGCQEKQGPRPFYMVKTHGANVSFLDAIDMLTISEFHHMLLTRAVQHTGLTVSPPYPLMTSRVITPPTCLPSPPPAPTHTHSHPSPPRRRGWESESRTRSTAAPRTRLLRQTSCGS